MDEDIREKILIHLRSMSNQEYSRLTTQTFANWVHKQFPDIRISARTGGAWLHQLGVIFLAFIRFFNILCRLELWKGCERYLQGWP